MKESAARGYPEALAASGNVQAAADAGHIPSMIKLGACGKPLNSAIPRRCTFTVCRCPTS